MQPLSGSAVTQSVRVGSAHIGTPSPSPGAERSALKQPFGGLGPRWEFYSARLKRRISGFGLLLLDHFVRLECDPNIRTYKPWFLLLPEPNQFFADSWVTLRDGTIELQSVRFSSCSSDAAVLEHLGIQKACAAKNGWKQKLLTECDIRNDEVYLRNCHAMLPWLNEMHTPSPDRKRAIIGTVVGEERAVTIGRLAAKSGATEQDVVAIVVREYTQHRLLLEDIHTRHFGRGTLVASAISA